MLQSVIETEIVIVGAGLAGLASAVLLMKAGRSVKLIEAQNRAGGRIGSVKDRLSGRYLADLGPTWVWPAFQPVIARWIETLGLATFPQFEEGLAILDHGPDLVAERRFLPSQVGSVRLLGGPQAMIDELISRLPEETLLMDCPVSSVHFDAKTVIVSTRSANNLSLRCKRLVMAIPPRIALSIDWRPRLPTPLAEALACVPT